MNSPLLHTRQMAVRLASVAIAALAGSVVLTLLFEGVAEGTVYDAAQVVRLLAFLTFAVCGIGAFVLSVRAVMSGDRSAAIWAALIVGFVATALIVGELLVFE